MGRVKSAENVTSAITHTGVRQVDSMKRSVAVTGADGSLHHDRRPLSCRGGIRLSAEGSNVVMQDVTT